MSEFFPRGAKRRVCRRRIFLDFFVVQSEFGNAKSKDFLERGFFGGEVVQSLCAFAPPTHAHASFFAC